MPVYFNDGTDDPLAFDSQPLIGGVNSYGRASTIPQQSASYLKNVELSTSGITKSRRGAHYLYTQVYGTIHAIIALRTPIWDYGVMIFADGHVYLHTEDVQGVLFNDVYDSSVQAHKCSVTEINGAVFFTDSNGSIIAVRQNGSEDILVDADGNTIWDDVDSIATYDVAVEVTDPEAPTDVRCLTAHRFRLVCANGIDEVHFSNILPDVSDPALGDVFPADGANSLRVGDGRSDKVVALVPFKDFRIAVLKENSVHIINADPSLMDVANYEIQMVSDRVGCLAEKSAVRVGDDILFLSRDGIRSIGTAYQQDQIGTSDPLSLPIQDIIEKINWSYAQKSCATFWRGRYMLTVPYLNSTVPNVTIVYDTNTKAWAGIWTEWKPSMFDVYEPLNGRRRLIWPDTNYNNIVYLRDHIDEDATVETDFTDNLDGTFQPVPFEIVTRAMTFNDPISPKQCDFAELEFFKSKARVNVELIVDGLDPQSIESGQLLVTGTGDLTLDFILPSVLGTPGVIRHNLSLLGNDVGREFQVRVTSCPETQLTEAGLTNNEQRYIAMRYVTMGAYLETMDSQK